MQTTRCFADPKRKAGMSPASGIHDAYLKFIEDDFLSGQRIDLKTAGRPDPRPNVRKNASQLGDLTRDFDFTQTPRAPLVLSMNPKPEPTSIPGS